MPTKSRNPIRRREDDFRLWAFQVYWRHSFPNEPDRMIRFAKAIVASSQEVRNRAAYARWNAHHDEVAQINGYRGLGLYRKH